MSEIYFVRHGQASFGSTNYDQLSDKGHRQSTLLGEHFQRRGIEFDHVLMGDMVRHRETAQGIARPLGLDEGTFEVFRELNEFDFHAILAAYTAQFPEQALPEKPAVPVSSNVSGRASCSGRGVNWKASFRKPGLISHSGYNG